MEGDESVASAAQAHNGNNNKTSKRDRFKGALSRTKSKFKKNDKNEAENNDVVNDFLAAGRPSTSSWISGKDAPRSGNIVRETHQGHSSSSPDQASSPRPSTSDSASLSRHSPRRPIAVPKIDVSNSQRWPAAQPVGPPQGITAASNFLLRPEYHGRSQSVSSLTKRKGRARGLSVTFIDDPPTVIGEGGDDAPTPPVEISRAKARARSVSPMSPRGRQRPAVDLSTRSTAGGGTGASYQHQRPQPPPPPPPPHSSNRHYEPPDVLRPTRGLQRVQTGLSPSTTAPSASLGLDKEFEMTLQIGNKSNNNSPADNDPASNNIPEIIAPKPVRPVQPPPLVMERPDTSISVGNKSQVSSRDLKNRFREGDVLRIHHDPNIPNVEDTTSASASSKEVSPVKQRQYQNFV